MTPRTYIMLAIAAALAVVVVLQQTLGSGSGDLRPVAPETRQLQAVEYSAEAGNFLPEFEVFDAILDRPLFRADRRPAPIQETPRPAGPALTPVETDTPPQFTVVGTVTGPSGGVATIRLDNEASRVHVGDTIDGWRIDAITSVDIEVSRNGSRYRLGMGDRD